MDGAGLDAGDLEKVAKWPTRTEQLSILSGQMLCAGAALSGQLVGGGSTLAGQIASHVDKLENSSDEATAA